MDYKDYYKVMGIKSDASAKDIKLAYRRLARQYHPDMNKEAGAEDKFKELGEAYEVLKDPDKRQRYDEVVVAYHNQRQHADSSHFRSDWNQSSGLGGDDASMHDFFESLFGARSAPSSGTDLQANLTVSLEDAYHGVTKELSIPAVDGSTDKPKTIRVKIPSGVRSGQQLRMKGLGLASHPRGVTGDLLLSIHVNPHSVFDLMGDDVYVTLPITPWEAALGARIMVPTLDGEVALTIPSASQGGQRLRLKKRGWPGSVKGDQYIVLKMVTPVPKTDRDRELYQTMASTMPFNPRAKLGDSDNG